jgi:DNA-directed RNA polymerase subunit M/transcription elongation factor TFIIS
MSENNNDDEKEWIKMQIEEDIANLNPDEKKFYLSHVSEKTVGWNHKTFLNFKKKQENFDTFIQTPLCVQEGVLKCKKCQSRRVFSVSRQVRSGDESTTVFASCSECSFSWQDN